MNVLTIAVPVLRHYLHELQRRPSGSVRLPVGMSRHTQHCELIGAMPGSELGRGLLLCWTEHFIAPTILPPDCTGVLLLGHGQQRGRARGAVCLSAHHCEPIHQFRLIGPGMPSIPLEREAFPTSPGETRMDDEVATARWSRTIGALGQAVWERLTSLRYGIIGLGRTGSMLALALARLGARYLTLIDPDQVEPHNLGETSGLPDSALGSAKVDAVAAYLASAGPRVVPVPTSITRLPALHAAQACDVLVSCVDHDSARLAATAIATVFCKPLLDVATGVHGHGPARQMGCDVRLVLPGHCLLCCGGLHNVAEARQVLASAEAERAFYAQRDWRRERAGSLASLNHCAVGLALRLLEDFIATRVQDSTWAHLEFDAASHLSVAYPHLPLVHLPPVCGLCRLSGWGDEGLSRLVDLLRQEQWWIRESEDSTTLGK